MALTTISENSIGAGYRVVSNEDDTDFVVSEHVIVAGTEDSFGFWLLGDNHDVEVLGRVSGRIGISIEADMSLGFGSTVHVGESGQVLGSHTGVQMFGSSSLSNDGDIWSDRFGVALHLSGSIESSITNTGTIGSLVDGLFITTSAASTVRLTNDGTIQGGTGNSYLSMSVEGIDLITNRGLMIGTLGLGGGDDVLDNGGGTVRSAVMLGSGNDVLDNRGGTVTGTITGDDGSDVFRPGLSIETIDGGADYDMLDFSLAARGLRVSLADPTQNTREARGDTYTGIEIVQGSRFADTLIGDAEANILVGGGGADALSGGEGADMLVGGGGRDRIAGGLGDDAFEFFRPRQGGDRILDWGSTTGDDDLFVISVAGFGGGLAAGLLDPSQFRARASSNEARDADDRFIFRASDETLWFDRDGRGGAGPVLIADLQDGAVVTANDILLV